MVTGNTIKNLPDGHDRIDKPIGRVHTVSADLQDVRAGLRDVKARLATLESAVGERLYDTRPIWERALAEIAETRSELAEVRSEIRDGFHNLGDKMNVLNEDVITVRAENRRLRKRIDNLEPKTP